MGHPTSSKRGKLGCWTSLIALAVETWNLKLIEGHSTPFFDILSNFRCFGILHVLFLNVNSGLQVAYLHKVFLTAFWTPELNKVLQINSDRCFCLEKTCYSPWSRENIHQLTVMGKITCQILRQKATYQTQRELYDLNWFTREYLNHKVFEETREIGWDW